MLWSALIAVLSTVPGWSPAEAESSRESTATTVASRDGVRLTLGPTGRVAGLSARGREVSGGRRPALFSVRPVVGGPNLLPDPGFEAAAPGDGVNGWRVVNGTHRAERVADVHHGGRSAMRFSLPERATSQSVQATVPVEPSTLYRATAWFRSLEVQPTAAPAEPGTSVSPVRMKLQQMAGSTVVATSQAYGYTDTADWHRSLVGFRTGPDVTGVRVLLQVVDGSGTVWVDDVALRELSTAPWRPQLGTVAPTRTGAKVDVRAGDLGVKATVSRHDGHVGIDGWVRSVAGRTVPLQLRVTLPLSALGWEWWDDPQLHRTIAPGRTYSALTRWTLQQTSRYPWGTVSDGRTTLSLGLPLASPRLVRVEHTGRALRVTFDLGVSSSATSLGGARAPFSLVLFRSAPTWGFRGAVDKYRRIQPSSFVRRTSAAREGGWFGARNFHLLDESAGDFGLGLHMVALGTGSDGDDDVWGTAAVPWDEDRGINTTAYNHHWGYKHVNPFAPTVPSYDAEMARVEADAAMEPGTADERRRHDRAIGTLRSGARDINGRAMFARYNGFLQHYENLNRLPGVLDWSDISTIYQLQASYDAAEGTGDQLDAIHLDSVSGMRRWGAADDYDRSHWAGTRYGLTFSYDSGQVVDRLALGVAAEVARTSRWAHDRGLFLSSNFNGSDARPATWFGAQAIDWFGIEQGLPEKAGAANDPYTTVDRFALFKRVLAGQRPISTIDTRCPEHTAEELVPRFEQSLLYGIYAGCTGNATWPEEQRPVFAHYAPLLRELNAAGWEPVTGARVGAGPVRVERFGTFPGDGELLVVVHNPTGTEAAYDVSVPAGYTGGRTAPGLVAEERISGEPVLLTDRPGGAGFSGTLAPGRSAMVRLRPSA